eukprot:CAMPEP_0181363752 /NCGR_PEP_ID=MMETSP1106-20121128/8936_1 /TAXON_ID=81844 /ORGANISM="Mantoniella antarctica, Strain SL-175" /LENGTH=193 /DNA_ID=CAMNT_0023478251 /DNA_START=17 /DNA_END=594 /DNA_ORIENTATION=+
MASGAPCTACFSMSSLVRSTSPSVAPQWACKLTSRASHSVGRPTPGSASSSASSSAALCSSSSPSLARSTPSRPLQCRAQKKPPSAWSASSPLGTPGMQLQLPTAVSGSSPRLVNQFQPQQSSQQPPRQQQQQQPHQQPPRQQQPQQPPHQQPPQFQQQPQQPPQQQPPQFQQQPQQPPQQQPPQFQQQPQQP